MYCKPRQLQADNVVGCGRIMSNRPISWHKSDLIILLSYSFSNALNESTAGCNISLILRSGGLEGIIDWMHLKTCLLYTSDAADE